MSAVMVLYGLFSRHYIDLDIDKDREKDVLYHYAWVPTTGNLMYCMPKIGTRVFLYIPDHDERHAMSTSCIRTNGKQHPQMADYHNRYFTTEHFKQMNMLPDSMALIGVGEMEKPLSITMHDAMGISVSSHKTIVLRAGKGISISGKNVVFKTQRELRVIQGLGGTAKIEICNKIDVDAPKTNVEMTYHSATGRPQEKPSPDEDALARVLMFVMGAAMITCVTTTADLGPAGLMFGAMAGRVLPRITTGSGQIMMITGAAVPTLTAEALKRLEERLQALKNALISLGTYFPDSIFANQFLKQIPETPLYDGPYPDSPDYFGAAWDSVADFGRGLWGKLSETNQKPTEKPQSFRNGEITGDVIIAILSLISATVDEAAKYSPLTSLFGAYNSGGSGGLGGSTLSFDGSSALSAGGLVGSGISAIPKIDVWQQETLVSFYKAISDIVKPKEIDNADGDEPSKEFGDSELPKQAGLGQSKGGQHEPTNLEEKLAMEEAMTNPENGKEILFGNDKRWPKTDGWEKRAQNVNGYEIHYQYNPQTGAIDDVKIK